MSSKLGICSVFKLLKHFFTKGEKPIFEHFRQFSKRLSDFICSFLSQILMYQNFSKVIGNQKTVQVLKFLFCCAFLAWLNRITFLVTRYYSKAALFHTSFSSANLNICVGIGTSAFSKMARKKFKTCGRKPACYVAFWVTRYYSKAALFQNHKLS